MYGTIMSNKMKKNIIALILIAFFATPALATTSEVRISKQTLVEKYNLIEKTSRDCEPQ